MSNPYVEKLVGAAVDALVAAPLPNLGPGITPESARRSRRAILTDTIDWPRAVRAILTAMREPSEDMPKAGVAWSDWLDPGEAVGVWQSMLTAALAEEPATEKVG